MNRLLHSPRIVRQLDAAIASMQLDLSGLVVLTEAASGAFVTTALLAARAGAQRVVAVTRNSHHGSAVEVMGHAREWAAQTGVDARIEFTDAPPRAFASAADIVTNLGFVRPIDRAFVDALPPHAVIALMWEPWEFREGDVDASACRDAGILVVGTCETDPRLNTFAHVGVLCAKLLLECSVELPGASIVLIGSEPFGGAAERLLAAMGANARRVELPTDPRVELDGLFGAAVEVADALVLIEHRDARELVGLDTGIHPARLRRGGATLVHVCGRLDESALAAEGVAKHPARSVPFGVMTATTDRVGPRAVIDLHAGGLRAAEAAVRVRIAGGSLDQATAAAVATGLGLPLGH